MTHIERKLSAGKREHDHHLVEWRSIHSLSPA